MNDTLLLLLIPLVVLQVGLTIGMVVSMAKKPLPWSRKWWWLLLIPIATIGPIFYFAIVANILDEQASKFLDEQENRLS